jgi:hypothetical protein
MKVVQADVSQGSDESYLQIEAEPLGVSDDVANGISVPLYVCRLLFFPSATPKRKACESTAFIRVVPSVL